MRNTRIAVLLVLGVSVCALSAAQPDLSKLPPASEKKGLTYEKDIKPIFEASCVRCHSGDKPKGGLRLDSLDGTLQGSKEGKVITAGKSEKSPLVIAVARLDPESAMPPTMRPGQGRGGMRPGGPGGGTPAAAPQGQGGTAPSGQNSGGRPGGPGGPGRFGPPAKPLTPEQVSLVRAWIDQGAK